MCDNQTEDLAGYGTPDPEHVGTMFDGMIDTVTGNEGLTYAQRYVHGVLGASGDISSRTGVEGFFESVGNGLKAVWDYIVKVFKAIFGVFFKTEAKEKEAEVKEAIEKAEEAIKEAESPKLTPEKTKKVVTKAKTAAAAMSQSQPKAKIEEVLGRIEKAETSPTPADIKLLVKEVFEQKLVNNDRLKAAYNDLTSAESALIALKEKDVDEGVSIQTFLNGMTNLPNALKGFHDLDQANVFLHKASRCLEAMTNNFQTLSGGEGDLKYKIDKVQDLIKAPDDAAHKKQLQEMLPKLKARLQFMTRVVGLANKVMDSIVTVTQTIEKAIIIEI